jgi:hypothetical protein
MSSSAARCPIARLLVLLLATVGAWTGVATSADAHRPPNRTLVLHPKFHRVRGSELFGGSRYVFIHGSPFAAGDGVLIDGITVDRVQLSL